MNSSDEFLELISSFQGRLFGFLLSLTGDVDQANEILQETNLVLWKKSDEFQPGSSALVVEPNCMAFVERDA